MRGHAKGAHRTIQYLMYRIIKNPINGCWEWTGKPMNKGYCYTSLNGEKILAHRLFYRELVGPIPEGLDILHKCDNRICCNPDHLFPGTDKDNSDDKIRKGRENFFGRRTGVQG